MRPTTFNSSWQSSVTFSPRDLARGSSTYSTNIPDCAITNKLSTGRFPASVGNRSQFMFEQHGHNRTIHTLCKAKCAFLSTGFGLKQMLILSYLNFIGLNFIFIS